MKDPDFIIIGAQKAGTTTLYDLICQHPKIHYGTKELHFFDWAYHKGLDYYRSCFPLGSIAGEATPNYMYDKEAIKRIKKHLPNVLLIVIIRDPVDRFLSQARMEYNRGRRITNEKLMMEMFDRGDYSFQLAKCTGMKTLLLKFEDLISNPQETVNKVYKSLGLNTHQVRPVHLKKSGGLFLPTSYINYIKKLYGGKNES